jgi:hypothetical protein
MGKGSEILNTNGFLPKGERLVVGGNALTVTEYLHEAWDVEEAWL